MNLSFWEQARYFSKTVGDLTVSEAGIKIAGTVKEQELQDLRTSCENSREFIATRTTPEYQKPSIDLK